jgi:N-acetyl-anhydromuramoyl-L-alanine amidase
LLAGIGFFYLWFKGKKQAKDIRNKPAKHQPHEAQSVIAPEAMVQCQFCKVHLPQPNAIAYDDRFYCCKEHLEQLDDRGWIGSAHWRISPNQDARPENTPIDLLVIHHISLPPGEFRNQDSSQYIVDFFQNQLDPKEHPYFLEIADQKVSSHFLITRSGELLQFVSIHKKAWHAGASSFLGREKCNDFSIGVELEGDGETPFEEMQYQVLADLVSKLSKSEPQLQFAGHSDIAPERKTDPGKSFDWKKFQKETGLSAEKLPFGLHSR